MKKIYLFAVMLLVATASQAQKAMVFKMRYMPNHFYNSTLSTLVNMNMTPVTGGKQKAQSVAAQSQVNIVFDIRTGPANRSGAFPMNFEAKDFSSKSVMGGKAMPSPKNPMIGMKITGVYAQGQLHIDSIKSNDPNAVLKKGMVKMIDKMQGQINFPDRAVAVGQSFTQEIPFSMPAAGADLQIKSKIKYTLVSINNNLAIFNLVQTMDINSGGKGGAKVTVSGSASGTGKLTYDLSQNYPVMSTSNLLMKYITHVGNESVDSKMNMKMSVASKISAN